MSVGKRVIVTPEATEVVNQLPEMGFFPGKSHPFMAQAVPHPLIAMLSLAGELAGPAPPIPPLSPGSALTFRRFLSEGWLELCDRRIPASQPIRPDVS